jgi:hypothetical protein
VGPDSGQVFSWQSLSPLFLCDVTAGGVGPRGDHTLSFRLVLIGWSLLCLAGWLVLGRIAEKQEADCRAAGNLFCWAPDSAFLVVGLIAFAVWLVGALIAWGVSRIDARTTVVTVREGATVTKEGLVYRGGERLTVLIADGERLRESKLIE